MQSVIVPGPPVTKARARFTKRGGMYHPGENRAAETRTGTYLKKMQPEPMTGNIALACIFFRPNRQRADADNMVKHVCDSANRILWLDDSQVTAIAAIVELDRENPRSIIAFGGYESSLVRDIGISLTCPECGKLFRKRGSKDQKLCSRACQLKHQVGRNRLRAIYSPGICVACGTPTSKRGVQRCRPCWLSRGVVLEGTPP